MTTPVYIVEGFLGSGKTKLIENSLRLRHCRNVLIFQFEEGEEVLDTKEAERCSWKIRSWDRDELETHLEEVADRVERNGTFWNTGETSPVQCAPTKDSYRKGNVSGRCGNGGNDAWTDRGRSDFTGSF